MSIDAKLTELESKLKQIRRVKAGDYVLSTDHNYVVDALTIIRDIVELMKSRQDELEEKLEKFKVNVYPSIYIPRPTQYIDVFVKGLASLMMASISIDVGVELIAKRQKAEQTYSSSVEAQVTKP